MITGSNDQTSSPAAQDDATTSNQPAADGGDGANGGAPAPESKSTETEPKDDSFLGDLEDKQNSDDKSGDQQGDKSKDGQSNDAGELEVTLPEGVEVDDTYLGEYKTVAKEAGLTGEAASKLAAWHIERQQTELKAQDEALANQERQWKRDIQKDPDFGGDKVEATRTEAVKALRKYGGPDVVEDLKRLRLTNLPSLVRAFARVGRAMAEDNSGTGPGGNTPSGPDPQEQLRGQYPSMYNEDGSPKE